MNGSRSINADRAPFPRRVVSHLRQYAFPQQLEDVAVAEEARDRDVTAFIEDPPLLGIRFEKLAIGGIAIEPEVLQAAFDALADLAAHLAKACPPHVETRQRPLQKGYTIGVAH